MISYLKRAILIAPVLLLFYCKPEKEDVKLRLTHAETKLIDSIYTSRIDSLKPIWDSLCITRHDQMLEQALDSIIDQRLAEEAMLRNRK